MRQATISDIHANQDALIAGLEDIEDRDIRDVVYLGDIVGYGPEPAERISLVRERCRFSVMDNRDYALLTVPHGFNRVAAQAIECRRGMLDGGCLDLGMAPSARQMLWMIGRRRPGVPAILSSACGGYKGDPDCAGVDAFLEKSTDLRELVGAVEYVLSKPQVRLSVEWPDGGRRDRPKA